MKLLYTTLILALFSIKLFADPVIDVPDSDFNLGEVLPSQVKHHSFEVKNKGDVDLVLKEITPSCGCTTALIQDKVIPPGKSVRIETDITMPNHDGPIRKSINVTSNDPKVPTYTLYLNASVKSDFIITPNKIDVGDIFIGEKKTFKFTLKPVNKKPYEPSQVVYSKEIFTITPKQLDANDPLSSYEFTVDYFASSIFMPRKAFDSIKIYPYKSSTDLFVGIDFTANVKSYVQVSQTSIFRSIEKGKGHTEIVNYKHLKDKPFKIISATASNAKFSTNIIKKSETEYDVEIILAEGTEIKREDVMLTVVTDQEDAKSLKTYMTLTVKK